MSKLIEALKAGGKEFAGGEGMAGGKIPESPKSEYQMTQEQLASIYFSATDKQKKQELPAPVIIKVVEKPAFLAVLPWLIASLAFLLAAFSLFSTKRIFVDIKVMDDKAVSAPELPASGKAADVSTDSMWGPAQVSEGEKVPLRDTVFEGAGRLKSSADRRGLTLVNSTVAPFAQASLRFASPINLSKSRILFYAKGARGGENLGFALKDKDNVLAFDRGKVFPFPDGLTTEWQRAEIPLDQAVRNFDRHDVTSVRFEYGSNVQNKPGDTILIKDLQVIS